MKISLGLHDCPETARFAMEEVGSQICVSKRVAQAPNAHSLCWQMRTLLCEGAVRAESCVNRWMLIWTRSTNDVTLPELLCKK